MRNETVTVVPDALWDVHDVAGFLKLSASWVFKRAADGTLPTLRIGRSLRFNPEAIRAWVANSPTASIDAPRAQFKQG